LNLHHQGIIIKGVRGKEKGYKDFEATCLFCPFCREATPVKKRLLLILPEGEKFDYICARCGRPIGDKLEKKESTLILP